MGKQIRQIKWDSIALNSFSNILEFIKLDSPSNAKTIKNRILNLVSDSPKILSYIELMNLKRIMKVTIESSIKIV